MCSELGGGEKRLVSDRGSGRIWDVREREDPKMTRRFWLKRGSCHQLRCMQSAVRGLGFG